KMITATTAPSQGITTATRCFIGLVILDRRLTNSPAERGARRVGGLDVYRLGQSLSVGPHEDDLVVPDRQVERPRGVASALAADRDGGAEGAGAADREDAGGRLGRRRRRRRADGGARGRTRGVGAGAERRGVGDGDGGDGGGGDGVRGPDRDGDRGGV